MKTRLFDALCYTKRIFCVRNSRLIYLTYFPEAERYATVQKHVKDLKHKTGTK